MLQRRQKTTRKSRYPKFTIWYILKKSQKIPLLNHTALYNAKGLFKKRRHAKYNNLSLFSFKLKSL